MDISLAASSFLTVSPPAGYGGKPDKRAEVRDAAQQFEAFLIAQILRSAREGISDGSATEKDASGDCAIDFGEQQIALMIAQSGGFGIADMIVTGLEKASPGLRYTARNALPDGGRNPSVDRPLSPPRTEFVSDFRGAPEDAGGWGATLVSLR